MKLAPIATCGLLLAVLLVAGCRRKKTEPAAPAQETPPAASPAATQSQSQSPAPASAPGSAPPAGRPAPVVMLPEDAALQRMLVKFYNDNQRPAMSWSDLVRGKYIPAVPTGPDGKPLDWNSTMQRIGKASDRSRQ